MFERFTKPARAAVLAAVASAQAQHSAQVGCEHLLIGLASTGEPTLAGLGITAEALTTRLAQDPDAAALSAIGVDLEAVRERVEVNFGPQAWAEALPKARRPRGLAGRLLGDHRPFTAAAKKSLELALREALADSSREITGTHLLRGLLRAPGDNLGRILDEKTMQELRDRSRRAA
jgi:ATP-dependent Clp protease ATP-binding subunit ClpA